MRWSIACLLALTTIAAAGPETLPLIPSPAKRKPATEKHTAEELELFVDAIIADKAGELSTAEYKYRALVRLGTFPSALYNLADVKRRFEHYPQAVEFYKQYLAAAPDAPDRREVERLIELIENRPPVAVIDGEDLDAVVLVDGKLIGPSPVIMSPVKGPHGVDRIGPTSYGHAPFHARVAGTDHVTIGYQEAAGNVVLSGSPALHLDGTWELDGHKLTLPGRFSLPPGHYDTFVKSEHESCNHITFDVPRGNDITYVYVDVRPTKADRFCTPLTVTQQTLRLPR